MNAVCHHLCSLDHHAMLFGVQIASEKRLLNLSHHVNEKFVHQYRCSRYKNRSSLIIAIHLMRKLKVTKSWSYDRKIEQVHHLFDFSDMIFSFTYFMYCLISKSLTSFTFKCAITTHAHTSILAQATF